MAAAIRAGAARVQISIGRRHDHDDDDEESSLDRVVSSAITTERRQRRIKTLTHRAASGGAGEARVRADLESMLPKLDALRVRRFRIGDCDAAILELEEEDLRESADYLRMLLELDEKTTEKYNQRQQRRASDVTDKIRLKNNKDASQRLSDGLRLAEIAKRTGNLVERAVVLLKMAIFFESESSGWFWIAEQLYETCLIEMAATGAQIKNDRQGQVFNVIKYLYGRFIINTSKRNGDRRADRVAEALQHLNQVRTASAEKTWKVGKILGLEGAAAREETLYRESCRLLHRALLSLSRSMRNEDPELAAQAATHALERAAHSVRDEAIALYELGKSQLSGGHVKNALGSLSKFLAIAKRIPDPEGICDAHIEMAFAHEELEDSEGAIRHLDCFQRCAMRHKLAYKLAQAHYYTGEYLLNKSQTNLATPRLELAFDEFSSLGKTCEADRARCAAGISKGQEAMERYVDLILNCSVVNNTEAVIKICDWKNRRVSFGSSTTEDEKIAKLKNLSVSSCNDE